MIAAVDLVEPHGRVLCDVPAPLNELLGCSRAFECGVLSKLRISVDDWLSEDVDLLQIDEAVHRLEDARVPVCLVLEGSRVQGPVVTQVLTRYQRWLPLEGNIADRAVLHVLDHHRALFDLSKPLVRADYDHALDTWRWVLRLESGASLELQLAALLHDIERLSSEPDERVEHLAPDYLQFKRAHATASVTQLNQFLRCLDLAPGVIQRVVKLVASHEQPQDDVESCVLNDADSLSFFSLNSWGFVRYFGQEHTRMKVRYTLRRMSSRARAWLPTIRQHPCVTDCLCQCMESRS